MFHLKLKKENIKIIYIYFFYTLIFISLWFLFLNQKFYDGYTLIVGDDGYEQHYKALIYFQRYIKEIVNNFIIQHKIIIPHFDYFLGEGNDILHTFHYYVIGDPLNLLSFFVSEDKIYILYIFLIFFRMYLCGVTFIFYCLYKKHDESFAILAGSLVYVFGYFLTAYSYYHPFFANPMLYFPLILLGIDMIFDKKSPLLFIISVFIAGISNIYFFYMIVIFTVVYVIVKLFTSNLTLKDKIRIFINISFFSIIAVMIAGFILVPLIRMIFNDTRFSFDKKYDIIYGFEKIKKIVSSIFVYTEFDSQKVQLGIASPSLVFIIIALSKKCKMTKAVFLLICIASISPIIYKILNCNNYCSHRFMWVIYFPIAYVVVENFNEKIHKLKFVKILICILVFIIYCNISSGDFEYRNRSNIFIIQILLIVFTFIVMHIDRDIIRKFLLFAFFFISVMSNNYNYFLDDGLEELMLRDKVFNYKTEEAAYMKRKYFSDKYENDMFRYEYDEEEGNKVRQRNDNNLNRVKNLQYYYTFVNSTLGKFRKDYMLDEGAESWVISDYQRQTILSELSSVKYIINDRKYNRAIPFGFEFLEKYKENDIYVNKYPVPMLQVYDNYILEKDVVNNISTTKIETMIDTAIIDKPIDIGNNLKYIYKINNEHILTKDKYEMKCSKNISVVKNKIISTESDANIIFMFDKVENSEVYCTIKNIKVKRNKENKNKLFLVSCHIEGGRPRALRLYPPEMSCSGQKDFSLCDGYTDKCEWMVLFFDEPGEYSFDDITISYIPFEENDYIEKVKKLKDYKLKKIIFDTNYVKADIETDKDKIVVLSIPYSDGFDVYVNGVKRRLLKVNEKNIGVAVNKGENVIEFKYHTPFSNLGIIISIFGIILAVLVIFNYYKTLKAKVSEENMYNEAHF